MDTTKKQRTILIVVYCMKTMNSCQLSQQLVKLVFKYVCVAIANFNSNFFFPNQNSYESVYDRKMEQLTIIYTFTYVFVVITNFKFVYSFFPNQSSYESVYDWKNGQ